MISFAARLAIRGAVRENEHLTNQTGESKRARVYILMFFLKKKEEEEKSEL